MDNEIVAKVGRLSFTQKQLKAYFNAVADKSNWKNPINATVTLKTRRDVTGTVQAVIFFAGCVPSITKIRRGLYRVTAAGYYLSIGA